MDSTPASVRDAVLDLDVGGSTIHAWFFVPSILVEWLVLKSFVKVMFCVEIGLYVYGSVRVVIEIIK